MDPYATWHEMLNAFGDGDYDAAEEHAENLSRWIVGGGFFVMTVGDRVMHKAELEVMLRALRCGITHAQERS